ncbi:unnamed protein product, partial [Clonostachys rosea f. rosea IK726]
QLRVAGEQLVISKVVACFRYLGVPEGLLPPIKPSHFLAAVMEDHQMPLVKVVAFPSNESGVYLQYLGGKGMCSHDVIILHEPVEKPAIKKKQTLVGNRLKVASLRHVPDAMCQCQGGNLVSAKYCFPELVQLPPLVLGGQMELIRQCAIIAATRVTESFNMIFQSTTVLAAASQFEEVYLLTLLDNL